MRIDYARGCFSDNELEAAYVRRECTTKEGERGSETYTTYTASSASTEEPDTTSP